MYKKIIGIILFGLAITTPVFAVGVGSPPVWNLGNVTSINPILDFTPDSYFSGNCTSVVISTGLYDYNNNAIKIFSPTYTSTNCNIFPIAWSAIPGNPTMPVGGHWTYGVTAYNSGDSTQWYSGSTDYGPAGGTPTPTPTITPTPIQPTIVQVASGSKQLLLNAAGSVRSALFAIAVKIWPYVLAVGLFFLAIRFGMSWFRRNKRPH